MGDFMKRLISLLLTAVMSISAFSVVYGEETDYTKALEAVKAVVDVPEYDEFKYNIYSNEIRFEWSNSDNEDGLSIQADRSNYSIFNYNKNIDTSEVKENVINYEQARTIADEFLKSVSGDKYDLYETTPRISKNISTISYSYTPYINGYKLNAGYAYINVDLRAGEVTNFRSWLCTYNTDVEAVTPVSEETAMKGFFEDNNVELVYRNITQDDKTISKPMYVVNNYEIDAETGKLYVYPDLDEEESYAADTGGGGGGGGAANKITELEQAEIDKLNNAVTVDEGIKLVEEKFGVSLKDIAVKSRYIKEKNDKYVLSISTDYDGDYYISASINENRTITYFYYANYEDPIITGYDKIKEYVLKLYPDANVPENIVDSNSEYTMSYTFCSKYDGIEDWNSYVFMIFDEDLNVDRITYRYNDNEHIKYTGNLSNEDIWKTAKENAELELVYDIEHRKPKLKYIFNNTFTIDANTGAYLNSSGYEVKDKNQFTEYTDTEGKWYEEMAEILRNNGYKFESSEFKGDAKVTGADIIQFLGHRDIETYRKESQGRYGDKEYIEYAENPDKEITRYEMAKIMVEKMGYGKLAEKAEFVKPFADVNEENTANVAICKARGVAKGENGLFNGDRIITRAEMAAMVYYYLAS